MLVIMTIMIVVLPRRQQQNAGFAVVPMLVFVVVAPFFYAGMGFLIGALAAWIYNMVAARMGGVEMEFESLPPAAPAVLPA
jgi:hypothetical protein